MQPFFKVVVNLAMALTVTTISCKKNIDTEAAPTPAEQQKSELPGLKTLLGIKKLKNGIAENLDLKQYQFKETGEEKYAWIVALKPGALGFKHSKTIVSLSPDSLSIRVLVYVYDESAYVKNDFTTYNGLISVYNERLQLLHTLEYAQGKKIRELKPACANCALLAPGDSFHNWCIELPGACEFSTGDSSPGENQVPQPPDGGGGCASCYPLIVESLAATLNLNLDQKNWLAANTNRAFEIESYLVSTSEPEAFQIAVDHLNHMMNSQDYLSFVVAHSQTGDYTKIWWMDDAWLGNPDHFALQVEAFEDGYRLTAAERALIKKYPLPAYIIFTNRKTAIAQTEAKMGQNGLNDRSDAFRHCFFQAFNTISAFVGADLTRKFADAHETEIPPQLILESSMDLFNNNVGILYGQSVSFFISVDALAKGALNKVINGELRMLFPIYELDPNFGGNRNTATHGITTNTKLVPTN